MLVAGREEGAEAGSRQAGEVWTWEKRGDNSSGGGGRWEAGRRGG